VREGMGTESPKDWLRVWNNRKDTKIALCPLSFYSEEV
jgi:hypothetical protein